MCIKLINSLFIMRVVSVVVFLFSVSCLFGQQNNVNAELSKYKIQKAEVNYSEDKFIEAIKEYKIILNKIRSKRNRNSQDLTDEIFYRISKCHYSIEEYHKVEQFMSRIIDRHDDNLDWLMLYAESLLYQNKTKKVLSVIQKITKKFPNDKDAKELSQVCQNIIDWKNTPKDILLDKNLEFSGDGDASIPFFRSVTNTVYVPKSRFSKQRLIKQKLNVFKTDIFAYIEKDGRWITTSGIKDLNKADTDEVSVCLSDSVVYYTRCHRDQYKEYKCNLMYRYYTKGRRNSGGIVEIIGVNDASKPFYDQENERLYFQSKAIGSKGGFDIWYSDKINDSTVMSPVNMTFINTKYDEISPFVSRTGIIYFSSNRPNGMGNFDIYRKDIEKSGAPVNMKYPYNSVANDVSVAFIRGESEGFLVSDRDTKYSKYNVFSFNGKRPSIQGTVICKKTGKSIQNSKVTLYHKKGEKIGSFITFHDGYFFFDIENVDDYVIEVVAKGHASYKYPISKIELLEKIHIKTQVVLPKKNVNSVLEGVYFKDDRLDFEKSRNGLRDLLLLLYANKDKKFKFKIFYTKSTKIDNLNLSKKQARSLSKYLLSKGIESESFSVIGSGGKYFKVNEYLSNKYEGHPKIGRRLTPTYIGFMPARYHRLLDEYNQRIEMKY